MRPFAEKMKAKAWRRNRHAIATAMNSRIDPLIFSRAFSMDLRLGDLHFVGQLGRRQIRQIFSDCCAKATYFSPRRRWPADGEVFLRANLRRRLLANLHSLEVSPEGERRIDVPLGRREIHIALFRGSGPATARQMSSIAHAKAALGQPAPWAHHSNGSAEPQIAAATDASSGGSGAP